MVLKLDRLRQGRPCMPNRILRPGILESERVNRLSAPAEVLYRRLMSVVDDYGRYDGRLSVIRGHCYPLRLDSVTDSDVSDWLTGVQGAGLAVIYQSAGKEYLQLLDTRWPTRSESKYPAPPANICAQLRANAPVVVVVGVGVGACAGGARTDELPEPPELADIVLPASAGVPATPSGSDDDLPVLAKFRAAYPEAFPGDWSATTPRWTAEVQRLCREGGQEFAGLLTADNLRTAKRWGDKEGLHWGPGTFTLWLSRQAGRAQSAGPNPASLLKAMSLPDVAKMLTAFRALPEGVRNGWLAGDSGPMDEKIAAVRWWQTQRHGGKDDNINASVRSKDAPRLRRTAE